MKCIINNKTVEAKKIEDLGFQGGYYCVEVMYEKKLYKVVSKTKKGIYRVWSTEDRLQIHPFKGFYFNINKVV